MNWCPWKKRDPKDFGDNYKQILESLEDKVPDIQVGDYFTIDGRSYSGVGVDNITTDEHISYPIEREYKEVSYEEFLDNYPRYISPSVSTITDPPAICYMDWKLSTNYFDAMIAHTFDYSYDYA